MTLAKQALASLKNPSGVVMENRQRGKKSCKIRKKKSCAVHPPTRKSHKTIVNHHADKASEPLLLWYRVTKQYLLKVRVPISLLKVRVPISVWARSEYLRRERGVEKPKQFSFKLSRWKQGAPSA